MPSRNSILKPIRLIHLYVGVFISPSLIFFAITGGLQTFGLHEVGRGSSYHPPALLMELAQLHKRQTTVMPVRKAKPTADVDPDAAPKPNRAAPPDQPNGHHLLPMKIFFAMVSVGMLITTFTGLYMSYRFGRNAWVITALWVAGFAVPVGMLYV